MNLEMYFWKPERVVMILSGFPYHRRHVDFMDKKLKIPIFGNLEIINNNPKILSFVNIREIFVKNLCIFKNILLRFKNY